MIIVPLLPVTYTEVETAFEDNTMFIGEEKVIELFTNNMRNIRINNIWTSDEDVNYRLSDTGGKINLHLSSQRYGRQTLYLKIKTKKPYISSQGELKYDLPIIVHFVDVKSSRMKFLRVDQEDIILDSQNREGYEIQLENDPYFSLQKTYRIEDQEEPGGPLIAELYVKNYISNNRILCIFRPYLLHRKGEGYLYIKDDGISKFITNLDIIPKPKINSIKLLREGQDWTTNLNVHPGENFELRIEGESLQKAHFSFEGIDESILDTLINNEQLSIYWVKIPLDIYNREITIYNNGDKSGYALHVKEYQRPREYDYIYLEGNGFKRQFNAIGNTILTEQTIQNLTLRFDRDKIDTDGKLYGKQFLNIKITIHGKNNDLIEIKELEDIVICPGNFSQRHGYYEGNCSSNIININSLLTKKTYDLEPWSRITLEISNDKNVYNGSSNTKTIDIIYEKFWRFDIDVSFPTGLLIFG